MSEYDSGERGCIGKKRRRRGLRCRNETSAIQRSPQPVNGNLMSRRASLLFYSPYHPTAVPPPSSLRSSLHPPLPFYVFLERTQPERQHYARSSLAADGLCSFQLERQSSQLLSVAWKEPRHLCLVWSLRERWEDIKWNRHTQLNTCLNARPKISFVNGHKGQSLVI